jgi:hypothetical protein
MPRLTVAIALAALPLALSTAACTDTVPPEQEALELARTTWADQAPGAYRFTWQRSCECAPEATRAIVIEVTGEQISSALYVDDETAVPADVRMYLHTIDGVFAKIQSAIDEGAHAIHVEYDATMGYPRSVAIDYSAHIADEELSLLISDLAALSLP